MHVVKLCKAGMCVFIKWYLSLSFKFTSFVASTQMFLAFDIGSDHSIPNYRLGVLINVGYVFDASVFGSV